MIAALGDDAARALAEHKRFRERAVRELMVPVLSDGESIYNVRTGDTFILDSNCEGKLYGFDYTVTPLATLVDEGEDGIPYGAGVYAIETYGADMGHIDDLPDGECPDPLTLHSTVEDDDLSYSVASVLRSMERTALELELSGHTALLETPESVAMLFGHDAATALCQHSNFRRDAAEIMSRALDLDDFLYNVYSGTAFIPDKAPDGEFFGFHVAHIPLSAILEDDIDPLSPDACDYGLDSISETTEDAAVGYFDPAGAVDDEKFLTSADWALCDIESSVLTAFGAGCSPELAGWTLGNAESVAETCASLGVDIATAPAPDNPARVAAAAKAATKATTHGVAAAAGNRL